jgi:hypothetical protein
MLVTPLSAVGVGCRRAAELLFSAQVASLSPRFAHTTACFVRGLVRNAANCTAQCAAARRW